MIKSLFTSRLHRNAVPTALLTLLLLVSSTFGANAQTQNQANTGAAPLESGKFRLHKLELPIGEESYEIVRDGDSLVTRSSFEFTDRGRKVPLSATLRTRQDLTPENFEIKGSVSRFSTIDSAVSVSDNTLSIREGKETRSVAVPAAGFFTLGGYAPVSMQMMMLRYVQTHRTGNSLQVLPSGTVTIEKRGQDKVKMGDQQVTLDRYSVNGLIWGREALWMDDQQNLVAVVTVDAEFDTLRRFARTLKPT
jgi:hypothetical protein